LLRKSFASTDTLAAIPIGHGIGACAGIVRKPTTRPVSQSRQRRFWGALSQAVKSKSNKIKKQFQLKNHKPKENPMNAVKEINGKRIWFVDGRAAFVWVEGHRKTCGITGRKMVIAGHWKKAK
jgi:hypothetical protein